MLAFALGSKSWRLWLSLFRWIFRSARKISIHQPGIDHMLGWTPMLMQKLEPNRMHMEETERFETWKGSRLINQSGKAELKLHAEKLRICCFPEFHTFSSCERSNSYMRLLFGCAKDDNGRVQRAWQGVSCSYDNEPHSKNNQHICIYILWSYKTSRERSCLCPTFASHQRTFHFSRVKKAWLKALESNPRVCCGQRFVNYLPSLGTPNKKSQANRCLFYAYRFTLQSNSWLDYIVYCFFIY